ncbi:MAG: ATP:cob(I)alamin adenosyltransferase [Treponema sp.]|jgi:cob(I)alamin adenosyltransferase|nr:ATP:cob(I)alamin adenosyltransferase [Treponema sp.]
MGISTGQGDGGFTGLPGTAAEGSRPFRTGGVRKDDPRVECLGALDELDAFLALCENLATKTDGAFRPKEIIGAIRKELFDTVMPGVIALNAGNVLPQTRRLEQWIAELEQKRPVRGFIRNWGRPGAGGAAAYLNIARTVCRRAERRMASLALPPGPAADAEREPAAEKPECAADKPEPAYMPLLAWINRLSDLLFLLAAAE